MKFTTQQAYDIVIYVAFGMFILVLFIITLMILANRRNMEQQKELDELRAMLIRQTPKEQSEWLQISGGRKILRRTSQTNNELPSVGQMVASMNV